MHADVPNFNLKYVPNFNLKYKVHVVAGFTNAQDATNGPEFFPSLEIKGLFSVINCHPGPKRSFKIFFVCLSINYATCNKSL